MRSKWAEQWGRGQKRRTKAIYPFPILKNQSLLWQRSTWNLSVLLWTTTYHKEKMDCSIHHQIELNSLQVKPTFIVSFLGMTCHTPEKGVASSQFFTSKGAKLVQTFFDGSLSPELAAQARFQHSCPAELHRGRCAFPFSWSLLMLLSCHRVHAQALDEWGCGTPHVWARTGNGMEWKQDISENVTSKGHW